MQGRHGNAGGRQRPAPSAGTPSARHWAGAAMPAATGSAMADARPPPPRATGVCPDSGRGAARHRLRGREEDGAGGRAGGRAATPAGSAEMGGPGRTIGQMPTNLRRAEPPLGMGNVVRVGSRGTSRRVTKDEKSNWTGEEYRKLAASRKEAAKDVYITVGRGTRKIRLGDIADTKGRPSGKGLYIETNRGTGRRKVE